MHNVNRLCRKVNIPNCSLGVSRGAVCLSVPARYASGPVPHDVEDKGLAEDRASVSGAFSSREPFSSAGRAPDMSGYRVICAVQETGHGHISEDAVAGMPQTHLIPECLQIRPFDPLCL